jgi:TolA-binding protein
MQLTLAADFAIEAGPRHDDPALLAGMVQRALDDAPGAAAPLRSGFARPSTPLRKMILPAMCVLLGGGVATGMWSVRNDIRRGPTIEELPVVVREAPRAKARKPAPRLPALTAEEEADLRPLPAPASLAPPAPRAPAPKVRRHGHRPVVAMAAKADAPSPTEMFTDAGRARRAGDYAGAQALYQDLSRRYPGSREELTGRIVVAQLFMDRHKPAEALKQFDSYLGSSPNGTLAEEARVGRATALASLARPAEEREAWQELLRRHPASVHAQRARDRLTQLR